MRTSGLTTIAAVGVGVVIAAAIVAAVPATPAPSPASGLVAPHAAADVPSAFVENRGQTDSRVRYYMQGSGFAFYLTQQDIVLSFLTGSRTVTTAHPSATSAARSMASPQQESAGDGYALSMRFVGANPAAQLEGTRAPGVVNYLHGSDPSRWQTALPRYGEIAYRRLWPGVDLQLREQAGTLKYEFHVAAGATPAAIQLAYDGASALSLDESGRLRIDTPAGVVRDAAPVSYQDIDGVRVPVDSRYALGDSGARFGFAIGSYRTDRELVIDPGIAYTTFLGGASHEMPGGTAVDAAGNLYVVGFTQSPDFPTTAGAFRRTGAASTVSDVFVTKVNPAGNGLIYSTFIGGSDFDFGRRIAVDAAGNAYITGQTKSANFPTTGGAFDRTFNILNCPRCGIDQYDTFVTKLNATGSALLYSTFLGGTDIDDARGIAVDGSGNAYVTGETTSRDFPTTAGAFQRVFQGGSDVFVAKLNPTGSALVYSTFLAGSNADDGERIAVDSGGRAFVMGFTSSVDFPTTAGAYDTTANGGFDVFVTHLNATGSGLLYSTLLGGHDMDGGGGLAIDAAGNAYVSGTTASLDFPTTPGAYDVLPDGSDAFISKLNPAGSALVYSTVLGGSGADGAMAIGLDGAGNAWITGGTSSFDFPVTPTAPQTSMAGVADAFVAELNTTGSSLLYSTYLGGSNSDSGDDLSRDQRNSVYIAGHTYSLDFPATVGAFDTVFNGDTTIFWGDAFITRIATDTNVSTPVAPPPVPAAPALLAPGNASNPAQPITFDWADAAGAASYTIQIDDSSAFTAPLIRTADLTTSIYATSGLATTPHFWRVRGLNVAGVAGAWSATRTFTPQTAPPAATLSTMSTSPSSVAGGTAASGTVVLSVGAPEGGATIGLSSSNPAAAAVPTSVTITANGFAGTFNITTAPVAANTTVTITASYNGSTRSTTILVTAPGTPASLQSLILMPDAVTGGTAAQGVVSLSAAAPVATVVALSSSNPSLAAVPATVIVPAGAATAVFAISTASVSTSSAVVISALYGGTTRTGSLTLSAAAPPPTTAALTLAATGRSGIHVVSAPAGLDVVTGSSASAPFAIGTSITMTVSGGRDAVFSGSCSTSGKAKKCTFTLNGTASVSVNVQ